MYPSGIESIIFNKHKENLFFFLFPMGKNRNNFISELYTMLSLCKIITIDFKQVQILLQNKDTLFNK